MRQVLATGGDVSRCPRSPLARSSKALSAARHSRPGISSTPCAACSNGPLPPSTSTSIRPPARPLRKPKTKGFPEWTEEELDQYAARWPLGTRERVMWGVFCFTGLRRGDAARLGKQHIRNGVITIDTEKTGTRVTIPVLPELAEILAAGPLGELSIIASKKGQPIRKEVVGNSVQESLRCRRHPRQERPRHPQGCGDARRQQRGHGGDPGGDLRMGRRTDGCALHQGRRPPPAGCGAHGKTVQNRNVYSRTSWEGAGHELRMDNEYQCV